MINKQSLVIVTSGLIASGKSSLLKNLAKSFEEAKYTCFTIRSDAMRIEEYTEAMFYVDHADNPEADYNVEIWNRYFKRLQDNLDWTQVTAIRKHVLLSKNYVRKTKLVFLDYD